MIRQPDFLKVSLEDDIPEENMRILIENISLLPGVISVAPSTAPDLATQIAEQLAPNILFVWLRSARQVPPAPEPPP